MRGMYLRSGITGASVLYCAVRREMCVKKDVVKDTNYRSLALYACPALVEGTFLSNREIRITNQLERRL
jgi:hypothetical protein